MSATQTFNICDNSLLRAPNSNSGQNRRAKKHQQLLHAVFENNVSLVQQLLLSTPQLLADRPIRYIYLAASKGFVEIVKILLDADITLPSNFESFPYARPVAIAAKRGYPEVIREFFKRMTQSQLVDVQKEYTKYPLAIEIAEEIRLKRIALTVALLFMGSYKQQKERI